MSRELAIRHGVLFPGAETSTIALLPGRRLWGDRPGLIVLVGAIATSVLVALELANVGGEAAAFQNMYTTTAGASATVAMVMLARRPVAGFLPYRTLALAIGCTGLALALLSLAPAPGASPVVAVDDAGAGYAGLRHILELRPQFVKLDLSLVRHVDTDPDPPGHQCRPGLPLRKAWTGHDELSREPE